METILDSPIVTKNIHSGYAGFWLRFVASFIDGLVLMIPSWLISYLILGNDLGSSDPSRIMGKIFLLYGINIIIHALYFAFMESSENQGTLGKMALGLKVTDINGEKITFLNAFGRNLAKLISGLILLIGYIMAAFTEKKQALHDILAGCLVVKK